MKQSQGIGGIPHRFKRQQAPQATNAVPAYCAPEWNDDGIGRVLVLPGAAQRRTQSFL